MMSREEWHTSLANELSQILSTVCGGEAYGLILGRIAVCFVVSVLNTLPPIPLGWRSLLKEERRKPYYHGLDAFLEKERAGGQMILPARKDIFNALAATSYE
jgi:hypothetical protein